MNLLLVAIFFVFFLAFPSSGTPSPLGLLSSPFVFAVLHFSLFVLLFNTTSAQRESCPTTASLSKKKKKKNI
jgi:hypothetical protein